MEFDNDVDYRVEQVNGKKFYMLVVAVAGKQQPKHKV